MATRGSRRLRWVVLLLTPAAAGLLCCHRPPTGAAPAATGAVVLAAAWASWLLAGYLLGGVLVVAAGDLVGTRPRVGPRQLQRFVEHVLGVGLVATVVAQPAAALAGRPHPRPTVTAVSGLSADWPALQPARRAGGGPHAVTRLAPPPPGRDPVLAPQPSPPPPGPGVPSGGPGPSAGRGPEAARVGARVDAVVVRPGDTLWSIAADHIGSDRTPARIAASWPRWWAANRAAIGAHPDLIHPGQRLRPPDPRSTP